jgi:uncharacterized protein YecT (DUF1311 family)
MKQRVLSRHRLAVGTVILVVLMAFSTSAALAASAPSTSHGEHLSASVVLANAARPSSTVPPPSYNKKCESAANTQIALDRCVASQVAQLDNELAHALAVEAGYLGHSGVANTQSKWLGFIKSECNLEARPYTGGSIQPLIYGECERGLLYNRIAEIRSVVSSIPK